MDFSEALTDKDLMDLVTRTRVSITRVMKDLFTWDIKTDEESDLFFDNPDRMQYYTLSEIKLIENEVGRNPFPFAARMPVGTTRRMNMLEFCG